MVTNGSRTPKTTKEKCFTSTTILHTSSLFWSLTVHSQHLLLIVHTWAA